MISFDKREDKLIAIYSTRSENIDWLHEKLTQGETYSFQKTFNFSKDDLIGDLSLHREEDNPFEGPAPIDFHFATLVGEYYQVKRRVLTNKIDVFLAADLEFTDDLFVVEGDYSLYKKIGELIAEDIYIGGSHPNAIEAERFIDLLRQFPSSHEKKLYAEAKISSILKEFFLSTKDKEKSFQRYLNKKATLQGENLLHTFQEVEIQKYQTIHEKLVVMLGEENSYSEKQWQKEILQIILLLYPKYIAVFPEVPVYADEIKEKFLDFLLVDANGNVDIIEIKKPFDDAIITTGLFRDNYIPLRELSGTVMQIEKYIYYLNRWSLKGEKFLTEKYQNELPENFQINITNPSAIIIMGRENNLTNAQKKDFEVVKRKYKNVVDIITYDNLLQRLKFTIEQIKKL